MSPRDVKPPRSRLGMRWMQSASVRLGFCAAGGRAAPLQLPCPRTDLNQFGKPTQECLRVIAGCSAETSFRRTIDRTWQGQERG